MKGEAVSSKHLGFGNFLDETSLDLFDGSFLSSLFSLEMKMSMILGDRFVHIDDLYKIGAGPLVIRDLVRFKECRLEDDGFIGWAFGTGKENCVLVPSPKFIMSDVFERWPQLFSMARLTGEDARLLLATGRPSGWLLLRAGDRNFSNGEIKRYPGGRAALTSSMLWASLVYWLMRRKPLYPHWVCGIHPTTLIRTASEGRTLVYSASCLKSPVGGRVVEIGVESDR